MVLHKRDVWQRTASVYCIRTDEQAIVAWMYTSLKRDQRKQPQGPSLWLPVIACVNEWQIKLVQAVREMLNRAPKDHSIPPEGILEISVRFG